MKINLRESLGRLDLLTDNKYDLRNTYDSSNISNDKKKKLAESISNNASAKQIYNILNETFNEDGINVTEKISDDVRDGMFGGLIGKDTEWEVSFESGPTDILDSDTEDMANDISNGRLSGKTNNGVGWQIRVRYGDDFYDYNCLNCPEDDYVGSRWEEYDESLNEEDNFNSDEYERKHILRLAKSVEEASKRKGMNISNLKKTAKRYIENHKDTKNKKELDELIKVYKSLDEKEECLEEDTVKQNGKWVNKGEEGTHGKFKTKKAADAQRKAMFANGYKGESLEEDWEPDEWEEADFLDDEGKKVYINIIKEAEDIDDLKDIAHDLYWHDKGLFSMLRNFPKDKSFEWIQNRMIEVIEFTMNESLNEDTYTANEINKFIRIAMSMANSVKKDFYVVETYIEDGTQFNGYAVTAKVDPQDKVVVKASYKDGKVSVKKLKNESLTECNKKLNEYRIASSNTDERVKRIITKFNHIQDKLDYYSDKGVKGYNSSLRSYMSRWLDNRVEDYDISRDDKKAIMNATYAGTFDALKQLSDLQLTCLEKIIKDRTEALKGIAKDYKELQAENKIKPIKDKLNSMKKEIADKESQMYYAQHYGDDESGDWDTSDRLENEINKIKDEMRKIVTKYPELEYMLEESLTEASYGGAYDIEDDMFWTKDDLIEFSDAVCEKLADKFGYQYDIADVGAESNNDMYITIMDTTHDIEADVSFRIKMSRIRAPRDLMKYLDTVVSQFVKKFEEEYQYYEFDESLKEAVEDEVDVDEYEETDFDDGEVEEGDTFIEDGREWSWIERIAGPIHLDFDNWAVWSARDWDYIQEKIRPILLNKEELTVETLTKIYDEAEVAYFVVDEDTGFIDWGPVESQTEAQDFLNGKVEDWENDEDEYDESLKENKELKESYGLELEYDDIDGDGSSYTYEVDEDKVLDYLRDRDDYPEEIGNLPDDEFQAWFKTKEYDEWLEDNLYELFEKHYDDLLDYFKDDAQTEYFDKYGDEYSQDRETGSWYRRRW